MQHRDRRIYGQTATPAQGDIAASRLLRLRDGRIVPIFMRLGIRSAISALVLTLQRIGPVWRGGYRLYATIAASVLRARPFRRPRHASVTELEP
jgi:hypothetical protein